MADEVRFKDIEENDEVVEYQSFLQILAVTVAGDQPFEKLNPSKVFYEVFFGAARIEIETAGVV